MKFLAKWRVRKPTDDSETVYVSERYGVRSLHIGSDTIQSSMRIARPNDLELSYTRSMMAFLLFVPSPADVLMIGLGGGSLAKFVYDRLDAARTRVIEVNPQVLSIARQYFHVPPDGPRFEVIVTDGAAYVSRDDVTTDILVVDGYEADAHAEELASRAFYAAGLQRLRPGGVMVVNLWGGDKLYNTLLQRIKDAFPGGTLCLPAERPGNVIVFAFERAPGPFRWSDLARGADALQNEHGLEYPRFVEGLRKMNRHDAEHLYA
ncbi:MAG: Spermidine synthase [Betaproteobacteria bacterium]|jgi:spermidine synthase|nr:Spermidine synthase [Betaproteobacteria bacterium]MEA3153571.1 spermidine synthase [Betaproteobacteria bacterium]